MELNIDDITRWVETSELDEKFASIEEQDPEWFEHSIFSVCDDSTLLKFASNRSSEKRIFFANLLASSLCWVYRHEFSLPFHFSRFRGLMPIEEYKKNLAQLADKIYEKSAILDKMQESEQEEIKQLSNTILDFRHDRSSVRDEGYHKYFKELNNEIMASFSPNVTAYQPRRCKKCNSDFRYWYGNTTDIDRSPIICPKCGPKQNNA